MKILNKTIVLLSLLFAFPVIASEDVSLKKFMKPIYEFAADAEPSEGVTTAACFGRFGIHSLPVVGAVNSESRTCKYFYKQGSELSKTSILDGANTEWMDISYDNLLAWLQKHGRKLFDSTTGKPYFIFTYSQITGSTGVMEEQDNELCALWIDKRQLSFGYPVTKEGNKNDCVASGNSSYIATEASWEDSFDKISDSAWCSNRHEYDFCSPTEVKGAHSEEECAQSALVQTSVSGYCWDGGTCCHLTDILNTNDDDGGNNKCRLKKGKNKNDYLVRCKN